MDESTPVAERALRERLGVLATAAGRDVRALAELVGGEVLHAAALAMWDRRGWVVAATDRGLRLARRPLLIGRASDRSYAWEDLGEVSMGLERVGLRFGSERLELELAGPRAELVRLVECARTRGGRVKAAVDLRELHELGRRKLGKRLSSAYEGLIDALPDRLHPGERVERLAIATHGFTGLVALTDRRLLLLQLGLRGTHGWWSTERVAIRGVSVTEDGLRLDLPGGPVELKRFLPPERRDELAAVLA